MFASTVYWKRYDPFFRQKDEAFQSSRDGVIELAERFGEFAEGRGKYYQAGDPAQQKLVFVLHYLRTVLTLFLE
jgi:Damage-control phosphatase ARMT1-like domain